MKNKAATKENILLQLDSLSEKQLEVLYHIIIDMKKIKKAFWNS
jgi:hypothetical protein